MRPVRKYREDGQRIIKRHGMWVRRPMAVPVVPDPWWYTVLQIVTDVAILLVLMFGLPLLIWLVLG